MIKKSLLLLFIMVAPLFSANMEPFDFQKKSSCTSFVDEKKHPPVFRVLSITGGGMRGVIPAEIVRQIENKTERPISESFHLIAGTSIGGILALGLTVAENVDSTKQKNSVEVLVKNGLKASNSFFEKNWFSFYGLLRPMYTRNGTERMLSQVLGTTPLSQTTTGCMVTSIDAQTYEPRFFYQFPSDSPFYQESDDFLRMDLAMAACNAPVVVKPHMFKSLREKTQYLCYDAGFLSIDPSFDAFSVAFDVLKKYHEKVSIEVVTLTCGSEPDSFDPLVTIQNRGMLSFASQSSNIIFKADIKEKKKIFDLLGVKSTYLDVSIPSKDNVLFNSSAQKQERLLQLTQDYLKNSVEFKKLIKRLGQPKTNFDYLLDKKTK